MISCMLVNSSDAPTLAELNPFKLTKIILLEPSWLIAFEVAEGISFSVTYKRGAWFIDAITAALAADKAASIRFLL